VHLVPTERKEGQGTERLKRKMDYILLSIFIEFS